jgi:hypothetical protein
LTIQSSDVAGHTTRRVLKWVRDTVAPKCVLSSTQPEAEYVDLNYIVSGQVCTLFLFFYSFGPRF